MTKIDINYPESVLPTPSHTVGPWYGYALPFEGGGDIAPVGHPDTVAVHGYVYDGNGTPVPDAFVEIWGADPEGNASTVDGSMRRQPFTGGYLGRNGVEFTGWGRIETDANGHWAVRTLRPGARGGSAPYLAVVIFSRGLLNHLYTRIYFADSSEEVLAGDPVLAQVDAARRDTLVARRQADGTYRFDIRLQGEGETVFLEFM
ncbi:protocatechuate 3,4-dioxygenase subunit alpha [Streptomyces sp. NPDC002790]|uniref:protocatechuate 3,4-dioxygenase subunit alpha n=1 Tax=Streptomyces sp. NPDC002790 TaxID=3154431 RepID=UPI003318C48A